MKKKSGYSDPRMLNSTPLKSIRLKNIMMPSYLWRVTTDECSNSCHLMRIHFFFSMLNDKIILWRAHSRRHWRIERKMAEKKLNYIFFLVASGIEYTWTVCLQKLKRILWCLPLHFLLSHFEWNGRRLINYTMWRLMLMAATKSFHYAKCEMQSLPSTPYSYSESQSDQVKMFTYLLVFLHTFIFWNASREKSFQILCQGNFTGICGCRS